MSEQYDEKLDAMMRRNNMVRRWKMQGIREFVIRVNAQAEHDIQATGLIEGAHHRAMILVLKQLETDSEKALSQQNA